MSILTANGQTTCIIMARQRYEKGPDEEILWDQRFAGQNIRFKHENDDRHQK